MFLPIQYTIYRWKPPELSLTERIWLGGKIAKIGRKAFAFSLKQRLSPPARRSKNNKCFTFADLFNDAEMLSNRSHAQARPSMKAVLAALLFFGAGFWAIAATHQIGFFIRAIVVVGPISIGSLLWMYNKVDRWAQSLIDEYAHAVANGQLGKEEASSTRVKPTGARLSEHGAQSSENVQPVPNTFLESRHETTGPVIVAQPAAELHKDTIGAAVAGPAATKPPLSRRELVIAIVISVLLFGPVVAWVANNAWTPAPRSTSATASPLEDAQAAYRRRDYASALQRFRLLADQGLAVAQNFLGDMYATGQGMPQNNVEAVTWYRKAADQGYVSAQSNLGAMYFNGQGVPQNDAEAGKWYRKAADQGFANAQFLVGFMYSSGRGVPQNDAEAVKWYRLAADQGVAFAQNSLGEMYSNGSGVPKNDAEALKWNRLAADQGDARAQFNLGFMYEQGQGMPQNNVEAVTWYRKAANQGYVSAQSNLGAMYFNGQGVPQNDAEAGKWYRKAADQGRADAQYVLGSLYMDGRGVPQNYVNAYMWLNLAAAQGDQDAVKNRELS